jgi:hypothetical protein
MLVRSDLLKLMWHSSLRYGIHQFYRSLPYTTRVLDVFPIDSTHANFVGLRKVSEEFRDQDRTFERENLLRTGVTKGWRGSH